MAHRFALLSFVALLAAACAGPSPTTPADADPPPFDGARIETSTGGYVLYVLPRPADVPSNELFSFTIHVVDASTGAPAGPDVRATADAAMPAHRHGMTTRPRVTRLADGAFLVEGMMLHMPGHWELYFDVTEHGVTERAQVDLELE